MSHDHVTEAACLLEQGASYRRRIGFQPVAAPGDPIFAGFKQGAFSLYFGDAPIYHFDLEGRWQRAFLDGTHYLKGLDATVHAIDRVREGPNLVLKRRTLTAVETETLDTRVRATALDLLAEIGTDKVRSVEPASSKAVPLAAPDLREFLARIGSWDTAAWLDHREQYEAILSSDHYFLPPECQNAVVLEATFRYPLGYGFDNTSIAESYVRSTDEFAVHAKGVAELWGRRLIQSRILFLAGSDVLHLPVAELAARLIVVGQLYPIEPRTRGKDREKADDDDRPRFDGVHAFMDDFARARPDIEGWRELAARGLIRISLGVESGDYEVRKWYRKDWPDDELRMAVREIKTAGLGLSLVTLVGAGGVERAEAHLERTVQLIESLELGTGDFVFLLDEKEVGEPHAVAPGLTRLEGQSWLDQQAGLKEQLAPVKKRGVKVLPYTLEKQWT